MDATVTGPSELFAFAAVAAVLLSLFGRSPFLQVRLVVRVPNVFFELPSESVFLLGAVLLVFFAFAYSLPLPLNLSAANWHFWLTSLSLALFWLSYRLSAGSAVHPSTVSRIEAAALRAQSVFIVAVLIVQLVFFVNLVFEIVKFGRTWPR